MNLKYTTKNCCEELLKSIQNTGSILINYNDDKCLTYEDGQDPTTKNLNINYKGVELFNGFFQFTYTFTEEEYEMASTILRFRNPKNLSK